MRAIDLALGAAFTLLALLVAVAVAQSLGLAALSEGSLAAASAPATATAVASPAPAASGSPLAGGPAEPPSAPTGTDQTSGGTGPGGDRSPLPVAPSPAPDLRDGYVWPLASAKITSFFADADDGFIVLDGRRIHDGLDLATYCGDRVRAAHSGTILYVGRHFDPYLGYSDSLDSYFAEVTRRRVSTLDFPLVVVIDDGNGLHSVYAHEMQTTVVAGQPVAAGQTIGFEGATGRATGCHLHYGLFLADGPWIPVAPELVAKWHYPGWIRLRVDPLTVLPSGAADAAVPVSGLRPPADPPRFVPTPPPIPRASWE